MKQVNRTAWLYKNHIYWRRPSARFPDMFKNAVKVKITFLPKDCSMTNETDEALVAELDKKYFYQDNRVPKHPRPEFQNGNLVLQFWEDFRAALSRARTDQDRITREEIRNAVVKIIQESRATFFVNDKTKDIPIAEYDLLYELKAEICTNVERYFYLTSNHKEK